MTATCLDDVMFDHPRCLGVRVRLTIGHAGQ
jgi:hypothetical protein